MSTKIATCLFGPIRGTKRCYPTLVKNIIDQWDCNLFFCLQNSDKDDYKKIKEIKGNIIDFEIYQNENLETCFSKNFYSKLASYAKLALHSDSDSLSYDVNFLGPFVGSHAALLARLNFARLAKMLEKHINRYDYFLITRLDHFYLFPIFDKSFLNPDYIFKYDGHDWGGINSELLIVPSNIVLEWLNFNKSFLNEEQYTDFIISGMEKVRRKNSEYLTRLMFDYKKWKFKTFSMNSFISADSAQDKSNHQSIKSSEEYIWKYDCQFSKCLENYKLWQNGYIWKNFSDKISLEKI
jgi:hypothetical protein